MSEKKLVIDQLKLTYVGIFDLNGFYRTIDGWFYEKGYDKWEHKNYEQVLPTGKDIEVELLPWKKTTEYFKNIIKIRLKFTGVKDVEIEKQGIKLKLNQGKAMVVIDGYLESDYENKWEKKPLFFLIRTIFDKFIFKRYFNQYEKWLINDVSDIHARMQKFLNIYRYERKV